MTPDDPSHGLEPTRRLAVRPPDPEPTSYGYLRLATADPDAETRLTELVSRHCADTGRTLAGVFVDRDAPDDYAVRPDLDRMFRTIEASDTPCRVVLVRRGDLATAPAVLDALLARLTMLGAVVDYTEDARHGT